MKKTTKFLLVLAAVVAMTIGAVSTVMAADYPVVASWDGDKGYTAEGTQVMRGWAVSKDSGIYYYFVNGTIAKNTLVKTGSEIYYLGDEGAMHTGWISFDKDDKVTYNNAKDVTMKAAFPSYSLIGSGNTEIFSDDNGKSYKAVWMYFDANGALVMNEWEQVDGIWYFFDGPFCLINDWGFKVEYDENGKYLTDASKHKIYGFDASGAMIAGWANYFKATDTTTNSGKPYEKPGESKDSRWVYYSNSGVRAGQGWLNVDGDWFFMKNDAVTGVSALTDAFLEVDGKTFYFDASGYMAKGIITLSGKSDANKDYKYYKATEVKNSDNKVVGYTLTEVTGSAVTVERKKTDYFYFDASNGAMITGVKDGAFYQTSLDTDRTIKVNETVNASKTAIEVSTETATRDYDEVGKMWTSSFLYVIYETDANGAIKVQNGEKVVKAVYYFENGLMVANDAVTFGDAKDGYILAFGSDGKLITESNKDKAVAIGDYRYYKGNIKLPGTDVVCSKIK